MKKPVSVALIGTGFAANFHSSCYARAQGARLAGVYGRDPRRAADFAQRHRIDHVFKSLEEVLTSKEVDAIDICVPNHLHPELCIKAAQAGKHILCEKPLTGYFSPDTSAMIGKTVPKKVMLEKVMQQTAEVLDVTERAGVKFCYAENWVYAPPIQKANRLLAATNPAILRIVGGESHSGSHSEAAKQWAFSGGGSIMMKGCHPLGATLYLKGEEGRRRGGKPIRPATVVAEAARLTQVEAFVREEPKWIKTGWKDVEDWGAMLITFEDGTVAEISAGDTTLGGVRNFLEVYSSRARLHCNMSLNDSLLAYTPEGSVFGDEYIVEKTETKAGWSFPFPDEEWMNGYPQEIQDFVSAIADNRAPVCGGEVARGSALVIYGAYVAIEEGRRVDLRPWW
ncbi:MAG TPA: Gfo/Idh/MocA family oxidoreductase [Acidobacteriota bacterium]